MRKTLPNTLLIGVQKGGTTALYNWISQHPDVYGDSAMKDFPFFCRDEYFSRGLDWFSERFDGWNREKIILHGYVHYLFFATDTISRLKSFNPKLKLIVVLRDPVERAFSAFLQAQKIGHEKYERFEDAIEYELSGQLRTFKDLTNKSYIAQGYYSDNIEAVLNAFPDNQLKVFLYEDICNAPQDVCHTIYRHLDLDTKFQANTVSKNVYGVPRSRFLQTIIKNGIASPALRSLLPLNTRIRIRHALYALNIRQADKPDMAAETRARLHEVYKDEILKLEKIINRDLTAWKQD
ncbi:MAG: sulfotransferase [Gammaproteobacteria bacterium]|nr:sulfotransferase [Gammaproteobacteria bacterium]